MPEKVLLATDGSKDAALAARAAVDVCERTGAELHVVHVWYSVPTARLRPFMRAELKKLGNEFLEEGVKWVEDSGGLVTGAHLVEGRAADEILDLAGQIGAGLIVIGSREGRASDSGRGHAGERRALDVVAEIVRRVGGSRKTVSSDTLWSCCTPSGSTTPTSTRGRG